MLSHCHACGGWVAGPECVENLRVLYCSFAKIFRTNQVINGFHRLELRPKLPQGFNDIRNGGVSRRVGNRSVKVLVGKLTVLIMRTGGRHDFKVTIEFCQCFVINLGRRQCCGLTLKQGACLGQLERGDTGQRILKGR